MRDNSTILFEKNKYKKFTKNYKTLEKELFKWNSLNIYHVLNVINKFKKRSS